MTPEQQQALAIAAARKRQAEEGGFAAQAAALDPIDLSIARSKNDAFGEYLRQQAEVPVEGESPEARDKRLYGELPQDRPGIGGGMVRAGVQGATFGAGDEIVGAGAAALDALGGEDFGKAYDYRVAQERQKLDQFRQDNPALAYGSEIAGAIPTAMLPFAAAPKALSTAGKVAGGMATGAGQGGLYGFNASEGGVKERAKGAVMPAVIGGAVGGAAVPIAKGAGRLAERYMENQAAKSVGMSGPSYKIMNRVMQSDDALTGAGAQRLKDAGEGAMVADAGPNAQALLDLSIQESGPAARIARDAIEARSVEAGGKLNSTLDNTLGAPEGVRSAARNIAKVTKNDRKAAYDTAYGRAIDYSSEAGRNIEATLDKIPDRVMAEAIKTANDRMRALGMKGRQIMANIADDGTVTFSELPNVIQLDHIKRALGEMGAEAVDKFGRRTGAGNMYSTLSRELKTALGDAVPDYLNAVKLGGDKIERDNALRLGYDLLSARTTREAVKEATADGMSDAAKQELMRGLRASIDDAMANVKRTLTDASMSAGEIREALKLVKDMSSRANREKVRMALGDDVAKKLFQELDQAGKAFELRAGVAVNSKTFARQALKKSVSGKIDAGVVNAVKSGDPVSAAKSLAQTLLRGTPAAKEATSDKVFVDLVKALTGPRGKQAEQTLMQLEKVGPLAERGKRRVRNFVAGALSRNAPVTGPSTTR